MTVESSVASHPAGRRATPILGLRRRPGRLALTVFRLPLPLYRRGWGWLLGDTFLLLVHSGRKTGSAWGKETDWIRSRLLAWIFGWGDLRSDAAARGFVSTRPFVCPWPLDSGHQPTGG